MNTQQLPPPSATPPPQTTTNEIDVYEWLAHKKWL